MKDILKRSKNEDENRGDVMKKKDMLILTAVISGILIGIGATPILQNFLNLILSNIVGVIAIAIGIGVLIWLKNS